MIASSAPGPTAIERSDRLVQPALEMLARFAPEPLGRFGFPDVDEEITTLSPERATEQICAHESELRELGRHRREEPDPDVQLDLEIVTQLLTLDLEKLRFEAEHCLPYLDPLAILFRGLDALLIVPVEPHRRRAAITRLRRYAGLETGYPPLIPQAETLLRAHLGETHRLGPCIEQVEADLARGERLLAAIERLFILHGLTGHEPALALLRRQLAEHQTFLRRELLPKTRANCHLPAELFDLELSRHGVDLPAAELARRAQVAFRETQSELQSLVRLLARERSLPFTSHQELFGELRRERIEPSRLSTCYQQRLAELVATGGETGLPPLPARGLQVRVANEAEMLFLPAPFLRLPTLLLAGTEPLEIVVPLAATSRRCEELGDYGFEAASWWLAAHEGWPGHGLQFAKLLEHRLSIARRFFGYNTAMVEGWALYAEAEIRSRLSLTAQIVTLRQQLLRCARAWLGLALQQGTISSTEAAWWLGEKVGISAASARIELERVKFLRPTADIAYFAGYLRLVELRAESERALGPAFEPREYHEAFLSRGFIPLSRLPASPWHTPGPCPAIDTRSS